MIPLVVEVKKDIRFNIKQLIGFFKRNSNFIVMRGTQEIV
jgi:hypothetical protein